MTITAKAEKSLISRSIKKKILCIQLQIILNELANYEDEYY